MSDINDKSRLEQETNIVEFPDKTLADKTLADNTASDALNAQVMEQAKHWIVKSEHDESSRHDDIASLIHWMTQSTPHQQTPLSMDSGLDDRALRPGLQASPLDAPGAQGAVCGVAAAGA